MKYQFREEARLALVRAKNAIDSGEDHRLRYAALELRLALEALTYDRAQLYKDEIPPAEYHVWQPGKLLKVLIEIEPHVNVSSVIRYRKHSSSGAPEGDWKELGHDTVIPMRTLHQHHNALGFYLHMATMKQRDDGDEFNVAKLRAKCETVAADVEAALASTVRTNLGNFGIFECLKCGAQIRKRLSTDQSSIHATCHGKAQAPCDAEYTLLMQKNGEFECAPHRSLFRCPTHTCTHEFSVWSSEVREGASWSCPDCAAMIAVRYVVSAVAAPE